MKEKFDGQNLAEQEGQPVVKRSRKEVEKKVLADLVKFEQPGDTFAGKVMEIRTGNTKFGEGTFVEMLDENGEHKAVLLSVDLKNTYDWESLVGHDIELEFEKYEKATNGLMKKFKLYELA